MRTQRATGRRPLYGDIACSERINVAVTPEHKSMLRVLAKDCGVSAWIRAAIERSFNEKKETKE